MNKQAIKKLDLPRPPDKPLEGECCGRGCEKCVFDYYDEAFRRWQNRIARILEENGIGFHTSGRGE
ncbi:MAG TPA: oxidoreductase-like domain-containing protein [Gammaproteobacteria bacterium]|nr:oxidoreductase-like domain-containing protein [Gammaproteobacteria bacterium]